jgi:HAD superfamily hydrolase (TIGR01509 family)
LALERTEAHRLLLARQIAERFSLRYRPRRHRRVETGAGAVRAFVLRHGRPCYVFGWMRALLFDVDGTLADTEETHRIAFNDAFRAHALPCLWERDQYAILLGIPGGKERLAAYFARVGIALDRVAAVHRTKTERYVDLVARGATPLRPGVARLIEGAAASGIRLAIASTTTVANVVALLSKAMLDRFDVLACGDVVALKKPAPDVYLHALGRLGVAAADAVAIEDSALGLAAAKAAGLCTVVTPSPWTRDDVFSAADLVLPHLADVTLDDLSRLLSSRE